MSVNALSLRNVLSGLLGNAPLLPFSNDEKALQPLNKERTEVAVVQPQSFLEKLPSEILRKIIFDHSPLPESFKTWSTLCKLNRGMRNYLNGERFNSMWPGLYQAFQKLHPKVSNLDDQQRVRQLLGFPDIKDESVGAMKRRIQILAAAGLIAELSEDGCATIVTIPAGFTIEALEKISQGAVAQGITSAEIYFLDPSYREILRKNPITKTQTFILTDSVIKDSRNKSVKDQEALLKAKGLDGEFPDALMTLTATVLTRILTDGKKSLYNVSVFDSELWTYVRTKQKTTGGYPLVVGGSAPSRVHVLRNDDLDDDAVGVGGHREFLEGLGP